MSDENTVYVVDDDESIRDAIALLLETVGLNCVTFASGTEFLEHPGVSSKGALVLDIRMPGVSGLEVQEQLGARGSALPIVFITGHGDIPMAVEAMKRGAVDFIRKPFRDQELLSRISEALEVGEVREREHSDLMRAKEQVSELTPRETEVFHRVARGQANKVIAIELGISERTVEIHRSHVMTKTGSRNLADLVRLQLTLSQGSD